MKKYDYLIGKIKYANEKGSCCIFSTSEDRHAIIITAFHIIKQEVFDQDKCEIFREIEGKIECFKFDVLGYYFKEERDVAVLHVTTEEKVNSVRTIKVSSEMEAVTLCGFPFVLQEGSPMQRYTLICDVQNSFQEYSVVNIRSSVGTYSSLEIDNIKGFSGGGVFYEMDEEVLFAGIENAALTSDVVFNALQVVSVDSIFQVLIDGVKELRLSNALVLKPMSFESIQLKMLNEYPCKIAFIEDIHSNCEYATLMEEYRAGINAHPEHIRNGLDIKREYWLDEIKNRIDDNSVLIIKGASGQGKSSLAYRFLLDQYEESEILCVRKPLNETERTNFVKRIKTIERNINIIIYMDVQPGDDRWSDLCDSWVDYGISTRMIVTVREEDFNRSSYGKRKMSSVIELSFSEQEAKFLFDIYDSKTFSSFAESWTLFGGKGPLMEYLYLLNHSEKLREKLKEQLFAIQKKGYDEQWIDLLSIISLAGKYNCPVSISRLFATINFQKKRELILTFENEFFVKISEDKHYLENLHVVRSTLLLDILECEFYVDEEEILKKTLSIVESDFVYATVEHLSKITNPHGFIKDLSKIDYPNSTVYASVLQALFWYEVKQYKYYNQAVLTKCRETFGDGFSIFVKSDITGLIEIQDSGVPSFIQLFEEKNPGISNKYLLLRKEFTSEYLEYKYVDLFLGNTTSKVIAFLENNDQDYSSIGYILFWAGKRKIFIGEIKEACLSLLDYQRVEECLDLMMGIWEQKWYLLFEIMKNRLENVIFSYYNIIFYKKKDGEVFTQFVIGDADGKEELSTNDSCMRVENAMRRYDPDAHRYRTKYLGFDDLGFWVPDTEKCIEKDKFYFSWITHINAMFRRMNNYDAAPDTWKEIFNSIYEARNATVDFLEEWLKITDKWYLGKAFSFSSDFDEKYRVANNLTLCNPFCNPKSILDKYGIVTNKTESTQDNKDSFVKVESTSEITKVTDGYFANINLFLKLLPDFLIECKTDDEKSQDFRETYYAIAKVMSSLQEFQKELKIHFSNYDNDFDENTEMRTLQKVSAVIQYLFLNKYHPQKSFGYIAQEEMKKRFRKINYYIENGLARIDGIESVEINDKKIIISVPADKYSEVIAELYESIRGLTDNMNILSLDGCHLLEKVNFFSFELTFDGVILTQNREIPTSYFLSVDSIEKVLSLAAYSGSIRAWENVTSMKQAIVYLYVVKEAYENTHATAKNLCQILDGAMDEELIIPVVKKVDLNFRQSINVLNKKVLSMLEFITNQVNNSEDILVLGKIIYDHAQNLSNTVMVGRQIDHGIIKNEITKFEEGIISLIYKLEEYGYSFQ